MQDERRRIPRTDDLLADPRLAAAVDVVGAALVKAAVWEAQELARAGRIPVDVVADVAVSIVPALPTRLRRVINATGVLVHTNLGLPCLPPRAPPSPSPPATRTSSSTWPPDSAPHAADQ